MEIKAVNSLSHSQSLLLHLISWKTNNNLSRSDNRLLVTASPLESLWASCIILLLFLPHGALPSIFMSDKRSFLKWQTASQKIPICTLNQQCFEVDIKLLKMMTAPSGAAYFPMKFFYRFQVVSYGEYGGGETPSCGQWSRCLLAVTFDKTQFVFNRSGMRLTPLKCITYFSMLSWYLICSTLMSHCHNSNANNRLLCAFGNCI